MKQYRYNFIKIVITILLFPYIYFKSKSIFKEYEKFCHDYKRSGKTETGIEMNSFEFLNYELDELNMNHTTLKKDLIQEYSIKTRKGNISCFKMINPNSNKWVIGLHGWTGNKYSSLKLTEHYYNQGYNIIGFDSYAHGKTYGSKTDIGYSAIPIIDEIIKQLKVDHKVQSIGLIGNSMGASTSVLYAQKGKHKIDWAIADCGFDNLQILYRYYIQNNWSHINWVISGFNLNKRFKKVLTIAPSDYDLIKNMKNAKDIPIMFIHGTADKWIPWEMSQAMFDEKSKFDSKNEIWLVNNADHVESIAKENENYKSKTLAFARKWEK
ncbi:alpha/beta hydrolase [Mesoplasma photuris]|uniref:alpha/beta hydrolase n=1 Tax=Mesoplasma photuris TaxID=217731 RepID=UPI00068B1F44|nr:alpha/beta hydrolase [Mesoplasma photuris]